MPSQIKVYQISDTEILNDARKYLNSPTIDSFQTSKEIVEKISSITKISIRENESLFNVCKNIKETVEKGFDGMWYCNAFYNDIGFHFNTFDPKFSLKFKFGKLSINVQKIYDCVSIQLGFIQIIGTNW
jgi:hypothetical protein